MFLPRRSQALLLLIAAWAVSTYAQLTCQEGPEQCPDQNSQAASSGGRVAVTLISATNLPNAEKFPESKLSDPYVELKVGGSVARTQARESTL
ncbi:unnamed protein product, partial [Chrysoparadoxa australica]